MIEHNHLTHAMSRLRCSPGYEVCTACNGSGKDPAPLDDGGNEVFVFCAICRGDGEEARLRGKVAVFKRIP